MDEQVARGSDASGDQATRGFQFKRYLAEDAVKAQVRAGLDKERSGICPSAREVAILQAQIERFDRRHEHALGRLGQHIGTAAAWQSDAQIAVVLLGCIVTGSRDPARALELIGNGGSLVLVGCTLGVAGEPAHQVQVGGFTQRSVLLVDYQMNHSGPSMVVRDDGPTPGAASVDLSAYAGVTRLEVVDITDCFGIAYDDFSFDFPQ